ncbi:hypothetical protein ACJA88_010592 [Fusarium oxysporum]
MHNPYSQVCAIPQCNRPRKHFTTKISPWCQYRVRCSYGINGALLRHQVDLETWTAHYTGSGPDSKQQALADKEFFASRERSPKPVVLGLDKADHAVRYALDAGLIDAGWIEGLEVKDPSPDLRKALQGVSLIIYAGGIKQPLGR